MSEDRDTHFQGFAKLLCEEIAQKVLGLSTEENNIVDGCIMCNWPSSKVTEFIAPLIAQRAYDLVFHLLKNAEPLHLDMSGYYSDEDIHQNLAQLPDLDVWPEYGEK